MNHSQEEFQLLGGLKGHKLTAGASLLILALAPVSIAFLTFAFNRMDGIFGGHGFIALALPMFAGFVAMLYRFMSTGQKAAFSNVGKTKSRSQAMLRLLLFAAIPCLMLVSPTLVDVQAYHIDVLTSLGMFLFLYLTLPNITTMFAILIITPKDARFIYIGNQLFWR